MIPRHVEPAAADSGLALNVPGCAMRVPAPLRNAIFREESVPGAVYGQASMLHIALALEEQPPDGYGWGWHAMPVRPPAVPGAAAEALQRGMMNEGVDLMGGGLMVSAVHTPEDIDRTWSTLRATLRAMKDEGAVG